MIPRESYPCDEPRLITTIEPLRRSVLSCRPVSPHLLMSRSFTSFDGAGLGPGVTETTVTGPTTHQSPLTNWPTG